VKAYILLSISNPITLNPDSCRSLPKPQVKEHFVLRTTARKIFWSVLADLPSVPQSYYLLLSLCLMKLVEKPKMRASLSCIGAILLRPTTIGYVCLKSWLLKWPRHFQNDLFRQYEASVQNHEAFIGACQLVNDAPLREWLERRDKVCRNFMNATGI
jgi:hypothetical protein